MRKLFITAALVLAVFSAHAQSDGTIEPVSKQGQVASPKVKVFPNPATNVVNVLGLLNTDAAQIVISDMYGNQVLTHEWEITNSALNIPVASLEAGIYIIVVSSKEQQVKTKFYKQ